MLAYGVACVMGRGSYFLLFYVLLCIHCINYATLFPMEVEVRGGVSLRGVMQINMKIKYFKDKIFPLVAENKCLPPFSFFVEYLVRLYIAFTCLCYRSW